jgi:hypothetical protein
MSQEFAHATPVENDRLTPAQITGWRERGFVLVSNLLPAALVDRLARAAQDALPAPGSAEADASFGFGSRGALDFPSPLSGLNDVTLHHGLIGAISDLLATPPERLRLTQSDVWTKYGHAQEKGVYDNSDQRVHVDYPNHTLAHPAPWHRPEAVELILYLNDWSETGGSTAVVPRRGGDDPAYGWPIVDSPGIGDLRYINDKASAEEYFAKERPHLSDWRTQLYEREVRTAFRTGDILFYRHDTWHRGTPIKPGAMRTVHNITYRRADAEWISTLHVGWAWSAYRDDKFLERLIAGSSLVQRAVLGFPQPGDDYWCEETIAAVEARYGVFGMDLDPYRQALGGES